MDRPQAVNSVIGRIDMYRFLRFLYMFLGYVYSHGLSPLLGVPGGGILGGESSRMNWESDPWFTKHYHDELSDAFKKWWVDEYGKPTDYNDESEYWVRCAFALSGWIK